MTQLPSSKRQPIVRRVFISLALVIATVMVYLPVRHHEFVNFDDNAFVTGNPNIRDGLTWPAVRWAFTADLTHDDPNTDYWRPVSSLSHELDVTLFGLRPAGHHLMNVGIHAAAAVALFLVLQSMTNAPWRCAFVAALFALHPLRVESVAWVAERKDVLSGLLFMVALGAYIRYVRRPFSMTRYLVVLFVFALALMTKPMVATLPFVLLLLDYWPLGRTRWAKPATGQSVTATPGRLLKEKIPFFVLAAASSIVTFGGRRMDMSLVRVPLGLRIANALLAYVGYIGKTFWPTRLAVFYPLHADLSAVAILGAGIGLVAVTAAVIWAAPRKRSGWLVTGWFWYVGMLVPVIGLVQGLGEAMADRFPYIPLIGVFIVLGWSVPGRAMERRVLKVITCVAAGAVLAVCTVLSRIQLRYWKNSETLFRHALDVTQDNWLMHCNLGIALIQLGRPQEAIVQLEQALRIRPDYAEAHNNLGMVLWQVGKPQEAIRHYEQALRIRPDYAEAHNNLGAALVQLGKVPEAIGHWQHALRIEPDFADAHNNLGLALWLTGKVPEAIEHWEQALRIKPDDVETHYNLGAALERVGRLQEASGQYQQALRIKPDYAPAQKAFVRLRAGQ